MKTPNFLTELLRRRLENRRASSAVAAESRAIKSASTNILNTINQLAKDTGRRADEIVAEYVNGDAHPEIEAALAKSKAGPAPSELDRMERASKAAKAERERQFDATKAAHEKMIRQRKEIEKSIAAKPKPAAVKPNRFAADSTQDLVYCVRKNMLVGNDLAEAKAELDRRGVTVHAVGFTISSKQ